MTERQDTILKWVCGIIWTLVATLGVILCIRFSNETKPQQKDVIKIEVPAKVAETSTIKVEIVPIASKPVDTEMLKYKDYFTNLKYYNGNIPFEDVYYESKKWTSIYDNNLERFLSLMYVESKFENGVVSWADCVGLCQLSNDAVDQFNTAMWKAGIDKFYTIDEVRWDWRKNIEVANWYLDWLWTYRKSYTTTERIYIQSYNYGRSGVARAIAENEFTYADAIIYHKNQLERI